MECNKFKAQHGFAKQRDGVGFSELLGGILANPQDLGGSCL
ncbi:hypothetical protein [Campylobacter upsaliensis]|nr:hypothetical protein [Campylobacter upsaliensis]MCR2101550.1 hypothetical protein [Campylobacter upsaliensis]